MNHMILAIVTWPWWWAVVVGLLIVLGLPLVYFTGEIRRLRREQLKTKQALVKAYEFNERTWDRAERLEVELREAQKIPYYIEEAP